MEGSTELSGVGAGAIEGFREQIEEIIREAMPGHFHDAHENASWAASKIIALIESGGTPR